MAGTVILLIATVGNFGRARQLVHSHMVVSIRTWCAELVLAIAWFAAAIPGATWAADGFRGSDPVVPLPAVENPVATAGVIQLPPAWGVPPVYNLGSARSLARPYLAARHTSVEPDCGDTEKSPASVPLVAKIPETKPECADTESGAAEAKAPKEFELSFYPTYDGGFVIRPFDKKKNPYELKINGRVQMRHVGFARTEETWTDNAGVTREIRNRNDFELERLRLLFSGTAIHPDMTYFVQLDMDSDGGEVVDAFDYWIGYRFSDACQLQVGKRKVAAVRYWILSALDTRMIDRPMSNDFFRPDRSTGLWMVGDLWETVHYEASVTNGMWTANLMEPQLDEQFTGALTAYIDPWGEFGRSVTDFDCHERPVIRLGHSFVYSPENGLAPGNPLPEADFARLTDGTRLDSPNALAPGVTVDQFDYWLYAIDVAGKYAGWSLTARAIAP